MIRGRPREFAPEQALDRAMEVFWQHGYGAVSITRLQRAMGISRQSLYNTFGGKHQLYVAVLRRFHDGPVLSALAVLRGPDAGIADVRDYVNWIIDCCAESQPRKACLVTNAVLEMGSEDPSVAKILAKVFQDIEDAFAHALTRARKRGELPPNRSPRDLARYFKTLVQGLVAISKSGVDKKEMRRTAEVALSVLERN